MRCDHQDQHVPMEQKKITSMRGYFVHFYRSGKIILPMECWAGEHLLPTKQKEKWIF
jgi:hypothetical protein